MNSAELKQLVQRATSAFQAGDYDDAERLCLEVVERTPLYANIYNMLGFIYSQRNSPERAIELFRRALSINPNYTEAQLNLAITLADIGAYGPALREFGLARAREGDPPAALNSVVRSKLANAHADLGKIYFDLGMLGEAVAEYQKALTLGPTYADVHNRLAVCYREQGEHEKALQAFARALEINPRYVEAYVNLGILLYRMGQEDRAIAAWEKALALEPRNHLAQMNLRMAKRKDRRPQG
jgi:tetratricopeptide (TPR) repeat protein